MNRRKRNRPAPEREITLIPLPYTRFCRGSAKFWYVICFSRSVVIRTYVFRPRIRSRRHCGGKRAQTSQSFQMNELAGAAFTSFSSPSCIDRVRQFQMMMSCLTWRQGRGIGPKPTLWRVRVSWSLLSSHRTY